MPRLNLCNWFTRLPTTNRFTFWQDQILHHDIERRILGNRSTTHQISLLDVPTNDAWVRDYGPSFVVSRDSRIALDWKYNAWGGKYPPFDDDQRVVRQFVGRRPEFQRFQSSICIEGGAIEVDADPVLMCTRSCALNPNRNSLTDDQIQSELKRCLGVEQVIWLAGDAIAGDDTDGHIDQFARFVPGRKILFATTAETNHGVDNDLEENRVELMAELVRMKLDYELIALPLPDPVIAK